MYMKQDLSDEIIVNSDLDTFCQDEAENMELNCEPDTCGDRCVDRTDQKYEGSSFDKNRVIIRNKFLFEFIRFI